MSYLHNDLPAPGRVSLTRVFAARLGHKRRRASDPMVCPACNTDTPGECDCLSEGASACSEFLEDREPIPSLKGWALLCAPAVVTGAAFALILWATKP